MSAFLRETVRSLDVGSYPSSSLQLTDSASGAVVAGSLVALDDTLSEQHQRDVLESLLLAQLAASAKSDRHKDPMNWYKVYQQTLETIGWVIQTSTTMLRYLPPGTRFTISKVVTDLFQRKVAEENLSLVTRTLNAFKRDPGNSAQFVFECPSHSGGIGNFQFGLATEEDGAASLQLGYFAFSTTAHVTRLAFEEFPTDAKFQVGFVALTLNEQVYQSVRSTVSAKVASRFAGSTAQIELAP
ncbi:hypothetical protein ACKFKF_28435 [Phormidesmis sp. 146-12]